MSKPKHRVYRHPFYFQIPGQKPLTFRAKVADAKRSATLRLTAEDVRNSIAQKGVGNTQTCSMAICAKRQEAAFSHPVTGYVDWTNTRAYVVSKLNSDGTPSECVVYRHYDNIARLNDTEGGQRKLLYDLITNGDRDITLVPVTAEPKGRGGKATGTGKKRKQRVIALRGANLRFAIAQLGGVPA